MMIDDIKMCAPTHCSDIDKHLNTMGKKNAWSVGHLAMVYEEVSKHPCYCTYLATGQGSNWQGISGKVSHGLAIQIRYDNTSITVSPNHVFQTDTGIKQASKMTPTDKLISQSGEKIDITSIHLGEFKKGSHKAETKLKMPEKIEDHLVNTNGVMSGDYAVQLFFDQLSHAHSADAQHIVGSPEYTKKWGDAVLKAPTSAFNVGEDDIFIPAEKLNVNVPADAHRFVSDEHAEQLKSSAGFSSWADPLANQKTTELLNYYKHFYPQVTFHNDWTDQTVNAFAWVENGARHVAIKGGLVQHPAVQHDGLALVIAHELGHHYGGAPAFPSGLSCEGQADWIGARDIMRKVWFGKQFIDTSLNAYAQMAQFFGVPNVNTVPPGTGTCDHPAGACRIATYYAALSMTGKPACAGAPVDHNCFQEGFQEELASAMLNLPEMVV